MGILRKKSASTKNYAYVFARVSAMKSKIMPKETYPKLMNMEVDQILRFIGESEYKQDVDELSQHYAGPSLVEHALNQNLARTYRKLIDISYGEPQYLIAHYLRVWDVWNIKTILRGKQFGSTDEEILKYVISGGELRFHRIKELVALGKDEFIESFKGTIYYNALTQDSLSDIENELDKAYYIDLVATKAISNPKSKSHKHLSEYVRTEIDIKNIKTLLRLKLSDIDAKKISNLMIPGGERLGAKELNRLAAEPFYECITALKDYPYWNAISELVSEDMTSLTDVEIALEKYRLTIAKRTSQAYPLSIVPVIGYIISKRIEVDNIRMIARGKVVGLGDDVIRSRLVM